MADEGRWEISERAARVLLVLMFAIKVAVTAWNAHVYDAHSYDYRHHVRRALAGGLAPGKMNYDPPLYYLPTLLYQPLIRPPVESAAQAVSSAQAESAAQAESDPEDEIEPRRQGPSAKARRHLLEFRLMRFLRVTNVLYIAIFYACWCFFALPRLLPDWRSAFLASALLMSVPGYQKLGAMSHAENLFVASAALCAAVWLALYERHLARGAELASRYWLGLAAAAGVVGLSRPFAAVPVGIFALVAASFALRGRPLLHPRAVGRLLAIAAIVGTLSLTWYVYRWRSSGAVLEFHNDGYVERFAPLRKGFDFVHYFTSFELPQLLQNPNRKMLGSEGFRGGDSFFTLLYSEIWGDHWLYFSGQRGVEGKLWPKRVLFVLALPVVPWLLFGAWRSLRACADRARDALAAGAMTGLRKVQAALAANERQAVLAVWLLASVGLYLYWQTGPAFLPGKNSTIKFVYTSTFYPLAIALATGFQPSRRLFNASAYYLLLLYLAALPVAFFVSA